MSSWCEQCQHLYDDRLGCPVCTGRVVESGPDTFRRATAEETAEHEHCDRAVDKLMGRDGDRLLATGTRSMWISLLKSERAAVRGDVARWIARLKLLEQRIDCARQVLVGEIISVAPFETFEPQTVRELCDAVEDDYTVATERDREEARVMQALRRVRDSERKS